MSSLAARPPFPPGLSDQGRQQLEEQEAQDRQFEEWERAGLTRTEPIEPTRGDPSPSGDDDPPLDDVARVRQIGRETGFTHLSELLVEEMQRIVEGTP